MLKILLADDHEFVRRSLKQILLEEYPLAGIEEAEDGNILVSKAIASHWDIIISDISMPVLNGLEALRRIKIHSPQVPILILSIYLDDQYAVSALKAGASGCLPKEKAQDKLIAAVREVLAGRSYIPDNNRL